VKGIIGGVTGDGGQQLKPKDVLKNLLGR
jgi:hypothetical protein